MSETPPELGCDVNAEVPATFERSLAELESIVQSMESGNLSLEQSLAAYRRGAALAAHSRKLLTEVEQQIRVLEADLLKPFDTEESL